jgi:flagellar biosynthesis protein FlhG
MIQHGHAEIVRPADQAAGLRRMVAAGHRPRPVTLAVTSGKGGVGKTNVAVNLCACLSARGVKVTLVDTDPGLANADLLLGVQGRFDLGHFVSGQRELGEIAVDSPAGVSLVAGGSGRGSAEWSEFDRRRLVAALPQLGGDLVVLDCGGGIGRSVMGLACRADEVLVVTTPEPTALADGYATVKTLINEGYTSRIRVLVNMVDSRGEAKSALGRLGAVVDKFLNFTVADAGYLLHDTHVELAVRQRTPFVVRYPKCSASLCMKAVAARWANDARSGGKRTSLMRRVVGVFG